jgi:hypothetical protein
VLLGKYFSSRETNKLPYVRPEGIDEVFRNMKENIENMKLLLYVRAPAIKYR